MENITFALLRMIVCIEQYFFPDVGTWYHTNLAVGLEKVLLPVVFKPWLGDWLRFYLVVFILSKKVSQKYSCLSSGHDLFLLYRLLSCCSLSLITMSFGRICSRINEGSGPTGSDAVLLEKRGAFVFFRQGVRESKKNFVLLDHCYGCRNVGNY
jgi:hypothetical protein